MVLCDINTGPCWFLYAPMRIGGKVWRVLKKATNLTDSRHVRLCDS
jgi:hypothetical protein